MDRLLSVVRGKVSGDKNRLIEGSTNLDLTYITERIIAMSFPAEGFESSYRNDINEVARFLKEKHAGNFVVFNLCSERGYNYALLDHQVHAWCGFPDHHAPPLALMVRVCRTIDLWLAESPDHVAVVHCKAGKGRTGTLISAYLLYCGLFSSPTLALNFFARRRSSNMFGVSSPSQQRYVGYAAELFAKGTMEPWPRLIVTRIVLTGLPMSLELLTGQYQQQLSDATDVFGLEIHQGKRLVHQSNGFILPGGPDGLECVFSVNAIVHGDVQLDVLVSKQGLLGGKKMHNTIFVQFHTAMVSGTTLVFKKSECDKVTFDRRFPSSFHLSVICEPVEMASALSQTGEEAILDDLQGALAHANDGSPPFFPSDNLAEKIEEARNMSAPVMPGRPVEKAGYLCKMGLTVRSWQDRWFTLKGSTLSYFKSPKNTTPSGIIPLSTVLLVTLMRDKTVEPTQPLRHALVLRTAERDYVLCSNDLLELEEWSDSINLGISQQEQ